MPGTDPNLGSRMPTVQEQNADPLVGTELGGFQVVKPIDAGGMGLVYEALHPALGRRAAVKVLKPEVAADAEWTRRFLSEARALGSLKHRNLIEVLNFGKTVDGREFLMMEFLDGEPLDAYIRRLGQLPPAAALGIVDQILNGLAEAHKKGVVHRDLKPSNVFLLREHNGELLVKVLDFGLARQEPIALLDVAANLPRRSDGASLVAGTPEYIAPEQAQGRQVDGRADLYSLGVMLYEMLTGQLPFEAQSVTALLQKHLSERPPRISSQISNLPEGVEEFLESLLEKDPERRPGSADSARVTVQRLLKRMSMDATAVRMLRPQDIVDEKKRQPTMKIDRESEGPGTDRALAAAFPEKKRNRWLWALPLLLLLLLLLFPLLRGGEGQGEEAPAVPTPTPLTPVAEKPIVEPPPEDIAPLVPIAAEPTPKPNTPAVEPQPKLTVRTPPNPKTQVVITTPDCTPTPQWKANMTQNLVELGRQPSVLNDATLSSRYEDDGRAVQDQISRAETAAQCGQAEAAFEKLRKSLKN